MVIQYGMRRVARWLKPYRRRRELYGQPCSRLAYPAWWVHDRFQWGRLGGYIARSRRIPGWTRGEEAVALALASLTLPEDAVVVEIGSFLGRSAVLLAGARKLRGSGKVYCIDPFDASGDVFSAPVYRTMEGKERGSLRRQFDENMRHAGLSDWVVVHQGRAEDVAPGWERPIDLLFLDGDQSFGGAQSAYNTWSPWLKPGGVLAIHNSRPGAYHEDHDGQRRLVADTVGPPQYVDVHCRGTTTFARKLPTLSLEAHQGRSE